MASHFISHDYLIRNKKTLDKTSVATPAAWTVPAWRAGKAFADANSKEERRLERGYNAALRHTFVAIEKVEIGRVRKPYLQPSDRRVMNLLKKAQASQ